MRFRRNITYSNIQKILPPKKKKKNKWKFSNRIADIFHISAQNIDCVYSLEPPRRGGCNEYPQTMLLSRSKKTNVYICKPPFYKIKVGLKGLKLYRYVFVMLYPKSMQAYEYKLTADKWFETFLGLHEIFSI